MAETGREDLIIVVIKLTPHGEGTHNVLLQGTIPAGKRPEVEEICAGAKAMNSAGYDGILELLQNAGAELSEAEYPHRGWRSLEENKGWPLVTYYPHR